jgi:hypothetical protein
VNQTVKASSVSSTRDLTVKKATNAIYLLLPKLFHSVIIEFSEITVKKHPTADLANSA